ncbi:mechanosensitive ion channel family protein [Simiduia sp. 21SJ11W-1]|uniref:mechanosensitive ion channel family protein n=1 Tax=Simiduia sp. 21SJ11W-1 TaxID=2909669 RepID=UPI0020A210F4|nr:mechanosensitive ion channel family protein [Simiduia sp. 21SJ11W-1]UTA49391.1 mechanosensitive ion channel family protein [Simiduia sp. 21SJ11W-1]
MEQLKQSIAALGIESWMLEVFILVTATLIVAFIVRRALRRLVVHAGATKSLWDDALFLSAQRPIEWAFWLVGISWAAEVVAPATDTDILNFVEPLRTAGIIALLTWFIVGFIARAEQNLMSPEFMDAPIDETTVMALGKLLRLSVIITAVLVALQTFGYSISGVLAFGGIGGIAVGFAAKDLLANFFGGLMIYLDRPFAVGDWVRSPDKSIEGTVEHIGWRLTRIRTFDKRPLYVPNSIFTQIAVENPSRMLNRRIYETIGIRYDDAAHMDKIVEDVKAMLQAHPAIDTDQTLIVNFNAFASSSLDFFVYAFTKTTNWVEFHEIKQDVLLKILAIVEGHGAECAFPTSTLHVAEPIRLAADAKAEQPTRD